MTCFGAVEIARLATEHDEHPHLAECLACRRAVDDDRSLRAMLGALPAPALVTSHRRAIAAELMAHVDMQPRRGRRRLAVFGTAAASALAAACALLVSVRGDIEATAPVVLARVDSEPVAISAAAVSAIQAPPQLGAPTLAVSAGAMLRHDTGIDRDVVTLVDGMIEIDTRATRSADVRIGDTIVHVDDAAVTIRARNRAVASVHVLVGAARVDGRDHDVILHRDSLWMPGPSAKQRSLDAFREGWLALRAGRHRDALALFDQVTDPVAHEEASYWAIVAAKRAGDAALAAERLAAFRRRFPQSTYLATEENPSSLQP